MKTALAIVVCAISISSCFWDRQQYHDCDVDEQVFPPEGYEITPLGQFNGSKLFQSFQLVNDAVGYALEIGGLRNGVSLVKISDGGDSWTTLNTGIYRTATSMSFKNEKEGFITFSEAVDCPSGGIACFMTIIASTSDGGLNWQEKEYPELEGLLNILTFDSHGNAYAAQLNDQIVILKSGDNTETWDTIYSSPDIIYQTNLNNFSLFNDQLYISKYGGSLIVTTSAGDSIKTIETPVKTIYGLNILDENNIIIRGNKQLVKTTDGGISWEIIHDGRGQIIDFTSAEELLIIVNTGYCFSGSRPSKDVIASTSDGAQNWTYSKPTLNLLLPYVHHQARSDGSILLLTDTDLWKIKKY